MVSHKGKSKSGRNNKTILDLALDENTSINFVCIHRSELDFDDLIKRHILPEWFIIRYAFLLDWDLIIHNYEMTNNILDNCYRYYDYPSICKYSIIDLKYIDDHFKIFRREALPELCRYQKLTPEFMRKHKDELDWTIISECQKLSMRFIEEMKDYVDWTWISISQDFSKRFIIRHKNRLNMTSLLRRNIEIPEEVGVYYDIQELHDKWRKEGEYI